MIRDRGKTAGVADSAPVGQERVIGFLSDPATHGIGGAVERHETHGAIVFLAGLDAYKIKRSVAFSYMDFSTLEKRRRAILHELDVNRGNAPGLYIGAVAVTREPDGTLRLGGEGEPVEWALHMRRFEQVDLLSAVAGRAGLGPALCRDLARVIHESHVRAPRAREASTQSQISAVVRDVAEALRHAPPPIVRDAVDRFRQGAIGLAEKHAGILAKRAEAGFVRRCHGDLHLGNIVMWEGAPTLFDAIEFDDRLATIDTLYDLAFLLMDLERRSMRPAANVILNRYLWLTQELLDLEGLAALPLFLAARAGVRAMVSAQRAAQLPREAQPGALEAARGYLETAIGEIEPAAPRLVAVGGLSGTGKTTLAAALAPSLGRTPGAVHVRSDLERKALFGVAETVRLPQEAYTPEVTGAVYRRVMEKAEVGLRSGQSVITDAVFSRPSERAGIADIAERCHADFVGLWLEAPAGTLEERVARRMGDASDATPETVSRQLTYDLGQMSWIRIEAGGSAIATLALARGALRRTE